MIRSVSPTALMISAARRTTFVEIGPIFAFRRAWTPRILPFPAAHTMGWGLELDWFDLERSGARLGIVDAVPIRQIERRALMCKTMHLLHAEGGAAQLGGKAFAPRGSEIRREESCRFHDNVIRYFRNLCG